jgi:hypothetical protein
VGKAAQVKVLNDRFNAMGATNDHELYRFTALGGGLGGLECWCSGKKGRVAEVDSRVNL